MTAPMRTCAVCEHESVSAINAAILNRKSYRSIAVNFRIGSNRSGTFRPDHKKVLRHAEKCMAASFEAVQEANLNVQGRAIQERLKHLEDQVDVAIADALKGEPVMVGDVPMLDDEGKPLYVRRVGHLRVLLAAVREGRHNQELVAKLAGAMPDEDTEALEASRKSLEDPEVRKLVQQVEALLAEKETREGRDQVTV